MEINGGKVSFSTIHDQKLYAFLSNGDAVISKVDIKGWTPMLKAIKIDNVEIVRILLLKCKGADLNFINHSENTPLTYAIGKGNLDIIELLLSNGADPNFEDKMGWTPLTYATYYNRIEAVKILIANNANLDLKDGVGITPLSTAIIQNNLDMVKLLVENGASTNIHNNGVTPFQKAINKKHIDIINFFMENGAKLSSRTKNHRYSAIELALKNGKQIAIMKNLIFSKTCNKT